MQPSKIKVGSSFGMLLMCAIMIARGSSFIFSKWLMDDMQPINVLAVRFIIAFLILCLIFNKKIREINRLTLIKGFVLGLLYTVDLVIEMYALRLIDAGTCSFIENSAIVIVPVYVSILTKSLPKFKTVICALIAFTGVGFLTGDVGLRLNMGVMLTILAALIFGVCILVTERFAREGDPVSMGILQIGFMGIFSCILTVIFENPTLPKGENQWFMILMLALVCSCFGFTFQPLAQKYISAETAGVFTAINPLTTFVLGVILREETAGILKIVGGLLVVFSVFLSVSKEQKS